MRIREALLHDAMQIVAIKQEIITTTSFFVSAPEEIPKDVQREKLRIEESKTKGNLILVAEVNEEVVGFLEFKRNPMQRLNHTGSFGMGIQKEHRGVGIGTSMLAYLIAWALVQEGLEKICLGVLSNNERALHVYHKLGFQEEGRQRKQVRFEDGTYADDIWMALHLEKRRK
jgi:RimJ/RimL family protein N-acetyltransferase